MDLNILFSVCSLCKERTEHHRNASKTTMRYHLTTVRMDILKKTRDNCWWECGKKGTSCTVGGTVQPLWKTVGLSGGSVVKKLLANAVGTGDTSLIPGLEDSWSKKSQTAPVFLPGKFHGQSSLVGYLVHGVSKSLTQLSN